MGARGKMAAPAAVRRARGDRNAGRKKNEALADEETNLSMQPVNDVDAPNGLGYIGKAEWDRIVGIQNKLGDLHWITEIDSALLYAYCAAFEVYIQAVETWRNDGGHFHTYGSKGVEIVNPKFTAMQRAHRTLLDSTKSLGLQPDVRLRLVGAMSQTQTNGNSPAERLLS